MASDSRLICKLIIGKDVVGSGYDYFKIISRLFLEGLRKTTVSVKLASGLRICTMYL
jgi:hypothetical protein